MAEVATQPVPRLVIRHALQVVDVVALEGDSLSIGRWSQCSIVLAHDAVSRLHAQLDRRADGWHITDLDSVNGFRINGESVPAARLTPGDVIEIRPYSMNFLADAPDGGDRGISLVDTCVRPTLTLDRAATGEVVKQRLDDLYALSRLALRPMDDGVFWKEVHAALQRSLRTDRCVLIGCDESAGLFRLAPHSRSSEPDAPLQISRTVLSEACASSQGILIRCVTEDEKFAGSHSLKLDRVGSALCVPILVDSQVRAILYADRRVTQSPLDANELSFAVAASELVATALEREELTAKAKELARLEGRIEEARLIQEQLLPSPIPQPAWGCVAARNEPADQMSGDIYDVIVDGSGRLIVSIADVMGKGVPAAFLTGILQSTLRQCLLDMEDFEKIARRINAVMYENTSAAAFATMVVCRWSANGDAVEIANAGHHAPLWVTRQGAVEAHPDRVGIAFGILPEWNGEVVRRDARGDSALLLSSDGATEAKDASRTEFGLEKLGEQLLRLHAGNVEAIVEGLAEAIRSFTAPDVPADDVTLLAVKKRS